MIRIGVFGAGPAGRRHIEYLKRIRGFEITGIYDPDSTRVKQAARTYSIPPFFSPEQLIYQSDALDFQLTPADHFPLIIQLLTGSRHLFIPYPFFDTLEKIEQLDKLAREADIIMQFSNIDRFHPALQSVSPFLEKPMFIALNRNIRHSRSNHNGKSFREVFARDIDLLLSMIRSNIQRISATGVILQDEPNDLVSSRLEFDNGCVANVTFNRYATENRLECWIYQRGTYFHVDFPGNRSSIFYLVQDKSGAEETGPSQDSRIPLVRYPDIPVRDELQELVSYRDSIKFHLTPAIGIDDVFFALKISLEVFEKIKR